MKCTPHRTARAIPAFVVAIVAAATIMPCDGSATVVQSPNEATLTQDRAEHEAFSAAARSFKTGHLKRAKAEFLSLDKATVRPSRRKAARAMAALAEELSTDPIASSLYLNQPNGRGAFVSLCAVEGIVGGFSLATALMPSKVSATTIVRSVVGSALAGGLGGALGAYFGTRSMVIPSARIASGGLGAIIAPIATILTLQAVDLNIDAQFIPLTLWATSLAGGVSGLVLADSFKPSPGQVAFTSTFTILGSAATALLHTVAASSDSTFSGAMLAGGLVSLAGASYFSQRIDWSPGRAGTVLAGGILGILVGALTNVIILPDDGTFAIAPLLGLVGGTALTVSVTDKFKPSEHVVISDLSVSPGVALASDGDATTTLQLSGRF
ncbi:MAG TPA: hypothetical protein DCQ06_04735 [Myxococcales bacterium]|nr:hypothetical protein [Myxococcales bacterium]HAN30881.1 hypothetical protein [Myxococcales bacterium]